MWGEDPEKKEIYMNLKKMWKRFWNLNVHNHEGFTLVELIIVIAILAILSGVAVAGYSSYIKKANMQADRTLVSEIENALLLAYYNGDLKEDVVIIVRANGTEGKGDGHDVAMQNAFGDSWTNLKLSYDGWNKNGIDYEQMLKDVENSTFAKDELLGALLKDVQNVVGILSGVIGGGDITLGDEFKDYLENNKISTDSENSMAISNAGVMYVAQCFNEAMREEGAEADFIKGWNNAFKNSDFLPVFTGVNDLAAVSAKYAYVEALARYVDGRTGTNTYVTMLNDRTNPDEVVDDKSMFSVLGDVVKKIQSDNQTEMLAYFKGTDGKPGTDGSQASIDAKAFLAYMQGVNATSDSLLSMDDLGSDTFYTDGDIQDLVTSYMGLGDLNPAEGEVMIYISCKTGFIMRLMKDSKEG